MKGNRFFYAFFFGLKKVKGFEKAGKYNWTHDPIFLVPNGTKFSWKSLMSFPTLSLKTIDNSTFSYSWTYTWMRWSNLRWSRGSLTVGSWPLRKSFESYLFIDNAMQMRKTGIFDAVVTRRIISFLGVEWHLFTLGWTVVREWINGSSRVLDNNDYEYEFETWGDVNVVAHFTVLPHDCEGGGSLGDMIPYQSSI